MTASGGQTDGHCVRSSVRNRGSYGPDSGDHVWDQGALLGDGQRCGRGRQWGGGGRYPCAGVAEGHGGHGYDNLLDDCDPLHNIPHHGIRHPLPLALHPCDAERQGFECNLECPVEGKEGCSCRRLLLYGNCTCSWALYSH